MYPDIYVSPMDHCQPLFVFVIFNILTIYSLFQGALEQPLGDFWPPCQFRGPKYNWVKPPKLWSGPKSTSMTEIEGWLLKSPCDTLAFWYPVTGRVNNVFKSVLVLFILLFRSKCVSSFCCLGPSMLVPVPVCLPYYECFISCLRLLVLSL